MKRATAVVAAGFMVLVATAATPEPGTYRVTGNTVESGEDGPQGWWFNRDSTTSTPYEFTSDEASIGEGSLHVLPIGANPPDKFIAEHFGLMPVNDLNSISYDFLIGGNGEVTDADHFYLNVYALLPGSPADTYYDCRFDYTPDDPADLDDFATATFSADDVPTQVAGTGCPATLGEMPDGSQVRAFAINVGDTSANDAGLAGYLDNVVLGTNAGDVVYDFEPPLQDKDDCKKGGYAAYGFDNQGQCVSSLQANSNAGK